MLTSSRSSEDMLFRRYNGRRCLFQLSSRRFSSLVDSCSEISESDSVSEASLSLRMKVEPYLFEPERSLGESNIVGEIEYSVEMDPFRAAWVGNDNWCVH